MSEKHISTTALARLLNKKNNELFALLSKSGWIFFDDSQWMLTEKGKFEGGIYVNHQKFGKFIAWPESIQSHPLLALLPTAPRTATDLGAQWQVPARLTNLILAERGWIKKNIRGWLLTPAGEALGGEQHYNQQSGVPYVTWPETLIENERFKMAVQQLTGDKYSPTEKTLSGRICRSKQHFVLENWLYVAGINHAADYFIADGQQSMSVDFFVPEYQLCLDVWGEADKAATLAAQLAKQEFYKKNNYSCQEIHTENLAQIDELLAKRFLAFGISIY